jgi:histidine ammonia-lyase
MGSYGLQCLVKAHRLMAWADAISAMSFDGFDGVQEPFSEPIHRIRPHAGQLVTAGILRRWLDGSEIMVQPKVQVQDPYSFRCIPQVHGATRDTFAHVRDVFLREINSVTDNPNIFPEEDLILSGGNFHGQPLAMALDFLSIAFSELANISERRTYQLISGQRGLPLFLVTEPGLHSGFMIPQYTAAGIVSENKQLCTPASVDSISSSNNQEDHVSMGANAATQCHRVIENVEKVLAIELMTASQALSFRHPLKTSPKLENILDEFRSQVPFVSEDRVLHDDMIRSVQFLRSYPVEQALS